MFRYLLPALLLASPIFADAADDRALAVFSSAFADQCSGAFLEDGGLVEPPARFDVTAPSSFADPAPVTIWQFRCNTGAYNTQQVYVIWSDYDGTRPLSFAAPALDITYQEAEDFESPVQAVTVAGWDSRALLVNSGFDPDTLQISETAFWRGIGDASHAAVWQLIDGGFRLVHYEVDASYDGQMEPQLVLDFP